jgi:DNA-binding CsgD family transcriptional regulator
VAATTVGTRALQKVERICDADTDARSLRVELLAAIRPAIDFDAFAWLVTDPETSVGTSPLADVPCLPELPKLIRLKYLTPVNRWTGLTGGGALLSASTGGDLSKSLMWRELLHDYRVTDIASSVYRDRFGCWGFLDLWRTESPPFAAADLGFLDDIAAPVTRALRRSQARTFSGSDAAAEGPTGPVVLVLSPALQVRAQTPDTEGYLRALVPPPGEGYPPIPANAYNVAAQLLSMEARVDDHPPMARVHLWNGRWLTLRAARLDTVGEDQEPDIAVSIETASPKERLAIFVRAFGLSPRATELLDHLVAGADTQEIAQRMFVSQHTIQDHLKTIFQKTSTRSRRALLALVLGG